MNFKKIAIAGVLALVILGCVFAAGCTNTTPQQTTPTQSTPTQATPTQSVTPTAMPTATAQPTVDISGVWTTTFSVNGTNITAIDVLRADGTGTIRFLSYAQNVNQTSVMPITWKKDGAGYVFTLLNGTFTVNGSTTIKQTYNAATDTLTDANGLVHKRIDVIAGVWTGISNNASEKEMKFTYVTRPDGTGVIVIVTPDYKAKAVHYSWTKKADGTYAVTFNDNLTAVWTYDSAKKTITSSNGLVLSRAITNSSAYIPITGPWYDAKKKLLTIFNADGTGYTKATTGVVTFTWDSEEFGTYNVHFIKGILEGKNLAGKTASWSYDLANETFTTSNNDVLTRPMKSVDGLELIVK